MYFFNIFNLFIFTSVFASVYLLKNEDKQLIFGLNKILNYLTKHSDKVNADCLFGIILAEGQLNLILQQSLEPVNYLRILKLRDNCRSFIKMVESTIDIPNRDIDIISKRVMKTNLWQLNSDFKNGTLTYLEPLNWSFNTWDDAGLYIGHPDEKESDFCISELAEFGSPNFEHECIPSKKCQRIMFDLDTSHGYPLTHKLLYIQVARALNCSIHENAIKYSITHLCSRILQEHINLGMFTEWHFRDLYVEQIVLCGMEGYVEFLGEKARKSLLQWPSEMGCYGNEKDEINTSVGRWRQKRMSDFMTENCTNHFAGLSAVGFALNLRYLMQG